MEFLQDFLPDIKLYKNKACREKKEPAAIECSALEGVNFDWWDRSVALLQFGRFSQMWGIVERNANRKGPCCSVGPV